jgi:hypothetical protein
MPHTVQSRIVRARQSTCIIFGSALALGFSCLLFGRLALCNDEVHVCVDGEADDFLVERLGQTAGLKVETEKGLQESVSI